MKKDWNMLYLLLNKLIQNRFYLFIKVCSVCCRKIQRSIDAIENGMAANPKLIKKFIELNPSILQNQLVVELIARYKKKKSR